MQRYGATANVQHPDYKRSTHKIVFTQLDGGFRTEIVSGSFALCEAKLPEITSKFGQLGTLEIEAYPC